MQAYTTQLNTCVAFKGSLICYIHINRSLMVFIDKKIKNVFYILSAQNFDTTAYYCRQKCKNLGVDSPLPNMEYPYKEVKGSENICFST